MRIKLTDDHKDHCKLAGVEEVPHEIDVSDERYLELRKHWAKTLEKTFRHVDLDLLHKKVVTHLVSERPRIQKTPILPPDPKMHRIEKKLNIGLVLLVGIFILLASGRSHCQFSHITSISFQNNGTPTTGGFFTYPFVFNCAGTLSCTASGNVITLTGGGGGGGGYTTFQNGGSSLTQRAIANFANGISCSDNAGSLRTDCTLTTVASVSHKFFNAVTSGALVAAQPACTDLSDAAGGCTMSTTAGGDLAGTLPSPTVTTTHLASALPVAQGGTGCASAGTNGQVEVSDGTKFCPADPIVSYNYANLMTTQAATGTVIGSAVRLSTFGGFGTLYLTFASITGSPSGCTVQLKNYDSLGNAISNGSAISVSPANGTTSANVASASGFYTTAQVSGTYACSVYPSTGTVSIDYVPGFSAGVTNFPTAAGSPLSTQLSDGASFYVAAKTGQFPAALDGSGFFKVHEQGTANTNLAQYGGVNVGAGNAVHVQPGTAATWDVSDRSGRLLGSIANTSFSATQSGTWTVQPGNTANTTPWLVQNVPGTTGGATPSFLAAAATTNATSVKGSAGTVYHISVSNTNATVYYLRMYNLATSPTCSSATGFVETIPIPAATTVGGREIDVTVGQAYGTGIAFCITGGASSTDNTSAATGVFATITYK